MSKLSKFSLTLLFFGSLFYWLSYYYLDQPVAQFFHHYSHASDLHFFCQYLTILGDLRLAILFSLISFVIAISLLFRQPQSRLGNNLLCIAIAMLAAIFFETSFKYLLGRYRPETFFQEGLYGFHYLSHQFLMNSTPSGHATRAFVFITGCSLLWKRLMPLFIALGLAVCASRLVLEFHFLSDVEFGAVLGTLVTLWIAKTYHSLTLSHAMLTPSSSPHADFYRSVRKGG